MGTLKISNYSFPKMVKCTITAAEPSQPHTDWISSAFSPSLDGGKTFPPITKPPILTRRGTICPQAALDYVVASRADDTAHSPKGVVGKDVAKKEPSYAVGGIVN
jgi:hypothetical protein